MPNPPYELVLDKFLLECTQHLDEVSALRVKKAERLFQKGNYVASAQIWRNLHDQGSAIAAFNKAVCLSLADRSQESLAEAAEAFCFAASAGIIEAKIEAAIALACGRGVEKDGNSASIHLRSAAESGNPLAQKLLGLWLLDGNPIPRDLTEACHWLSLAVKAGDQEAAQLFEEATKMKSK